MPLEFLNSSLVSAIALLLEQRGENAGGIASLAERQDLEPSAVAAMEVVFPGRAEKDRKVSIPGWERVGRVDLVVREENGSDRVAALIELKWCQATNDILFEAVWDLFKMALGTHREERPRGFLLTGAPTPMWATSAFSDLFEDGEHHPEELCVRELADKQRTLAWDAALAGGYDHYPEAVPASIVTAGCGRARVGEWELRAVEVLTTDEHKIPMGGGWPFGRRPARAEHPTVAPASPS